MSGNSSRKPSGSSTYSSARSPLSSPNTGHIQRSLNTAVATNTYGVGVGNSNGRKGLNSGWQVWGSVTPSSKKKTSVSSATSTGDLLPQQNDPGYRGGMGEAWASSRPTSGSWSDEVVEPAQHQDFSHMVESSPQLLHHARQRQNVAQPPFSVPRTDDRTTAPKSGQYSPQRYDTSGHYGTDVSHIPSSNSPTRHLGVPGYATLQGVSQVSALGGAYEVLQTSSTTNDELSVALRGMAVEDDYQNQRTQHLIGTQNSLPSRGPPQIPQPRPYGTYPPTDFNPYFPIPSVREPYPDYSYTYDAYRGPSDPSVYASAAMSNGSPGSIYNGMASQALHASVMPDLRPQPALFMDYGATMGPVYFSQPQPVMYPQPNPSPMVAPQIPATMADKKREMQYNIQQHLTSPNLLYGQIRSTPSPLPQPYGMDYGPQVSHMMSGGIYGPNPMTVYPHNMRHPRRNDVILPSQPPRSALLDEFRANKVRKWELRDIFGFIVEFSGDQHGSRFIQQKLETATMDDKEMVFNEIVPNNTLQLIRDVFGNYVIQKLFEHGTQVHKTKLVNIMEGHILALSLQMYGCRVVQKAIEYILPEQQGMFIRELEPYVLKCVKDSNGNHVIQKLVECVSPDRLAFVNSFHGNVYDLASHPYGCRVLQRCLENLPDEFTRPLMEELHKYTINLMQNQFGNYVIQYILEHGKPHDKALVVSKLRGQILQMARHKFASNVCEKALVCTDSDSRRALIDEIMAPRPDGVTPIIAMMKDQYANYVLQRALAVVEGDQRDVLISKIKPQLVSMRRYANAYTKHLNSIERLVEKYPKQLDSVPQLAVTPPEHTH